MGAPQDLGTDTGPDPELVHVQALLSSAGETGRYRLVLRVGTGGMGAVYKAIDTRLNRAVAIKAIVNRTGLVADTTERLRKEAQAAASLDHPYICRVYELIETETEQLIVMEFVEGETLSAVLRRGVPPLATTLQLGIEIAEGLANAHEHGLVHRDLKPANVMVTPHGHVKLLDFGLARADSSSSPTADTETGSSAPPQDAWAGTPRYMAPEQAEGRPVTAKADVFSLGVLLFECITGKLPFEGAHRHEYMEHLRADAPMPVRRVAPNTPEDLALLIDACLCKTPADRPESADLVVREMRRIAGLGSSGDRVAPARGRRMPVLWSVVALGAIAIAASSRFWFQPAGPTEAIWKTRPFVTSSAEERNSRVSPDKRWISYLAVFGGETQLLVKRIDGGDAQRVTVPPGIVLDQMWSPDGSQLAVVIRQDQKLFLQVLPAFFGGVPIHTVSLPPTPVEVRLHRWIERAIFMEAIDGTGQSLQRVDLDRGAITNVSDSWRVTGRLRGFDVSPDGRRVVYTLSSAAGQDDLWVASLDGSSARALTNDASFERSPLWSGAGDSIIYQSNRGGQADLWEISPTTGVSRQLTSSQPIETPESASADGTVVTFNQASVETHLWRWDRAAHTSVQITDDTLNDVAPAVSANGSKVVFERSRPSRAMIFSGGDSTLFVGALPKPTLSFSPRVVVDGFAARLSADGAWLAYLQRGPEPGATLCVKNLDTNDTTTISTSGRRPVYSNFPVEWADQKVAWNPSRAELYFVDGLDRPALRSAHVGTKDQPRTLVTVNLGEIIRDVRPSTDGHRLAYLVTSTKRSENTLHVLDVSSGIDRVVARLDGSVYARGWLANDVGIVMVQAKGFYDDFTADVQVVRASLDGTLRPSSVIPRAFIATAHLDGPNSALYVTRSEAGVHNIYALSLATTTLTRVTDNVLSGVTFSGIEPLADGSIVGVRSERKSDIWLMETDRGRLGTPGRSGR